MPPAAGAPAVAQGAAAAAADSAAAHPTSPGATPADADQEKTKLAWKPGGRRHASTMTSQRGGKALDAACAHDGWRTYEGATRWWIRCEQCGGRLAEGRVAHRETVKILEGWTPPGAAGHATIGQEVTLTGRWTCGLCESELEQGTASVLTGVGRICIPCRSGPGRAQAPPPAKTPEAPPPAETPETPPPAETPAQEKENDTVLTLNSAQVEYLQETLTVQQWHRLTALA